MPQVLVRWQIHLLLIFWSTKMQAGFLVIKYFFFPSPQLEPWYGLCIILTQFSWIWSGYLDLFTVVVKSSSFQTWSFELSISSLELQKRIAFIFMCLIFKHGRMHVYITVNIFVYLYLMLQNQFYIMVDNALLYMLALRFCMDLDYF